MELLELNRFRIARGLKIPGARAHVPLYLLPGISYSMTFDTTRYLVQVLLNQSVPGGCLRVRGLERIIHSSSSTLPSLSEIERASDFVTTAAATQQREREPTSACKKHNNPVHTYIDYHTYFLLLMMYGDRKSVRVRTAINQQSFS